MKGLATKTKLESHCFMALCEHMKQKKRTGRIGWGESRNKNSQCSEENRSMVFVEIAQCVNLRMLCPGISKPVLQMTKQEWEG